MAILPFLPLSRGPKNSFYGGKITAILTWASQLALCPLTLLPLQLPWRAATGSTAAPATTWATKQLLELEDKGILLHFIVQVRPLMILQSEY